MAFKTSFEGPLERISRSELLRRGSVGSKRERLKLAPARGAAADKNCRRLALKERPAGERA